ncbi:MAG TPA: hypothetical protein VGG19_01265 [Tepidisphaeraceae bacterium]
MNAEGKRQARIRKPVARIDASEHLASGSWLLAPLHRSSFIVHRSIRHSPQRRGTVLIVALGILFVIAALVVTLGRSMSVEATASANYSAAVQAGAVERGAEQYVIGMLMQLQQEGTSFYDLPDSDFAAVKIGDGYFWIVRPNYVNDPEFSQFGIVDESAKINLNALNNWAAPDQGLMSIAGVSQDAADALLSWSGQNGGGDYGSYYASLPTPYQTKGGPFESVEELLLVDGFTRELLYGQNIPNAESNSPTIGLGSQMTTPGLNINDTLPDGIASLFTVYTLPVAGARGTSPTPKVNVVDAPREVLVALMEGNGLSDSDADAIISARNVDDQDTSSEQSALGNDWNGIENFVTGTSQTLQGQYSADIVAVSGNGKSFKRVRVVIDASETNSATPVIIYRRDITDLGWPSNLDPEILTNLRAGQPISDAQDISQVGSSI